MRNRLLALCLALFVVAPASAQVSIGIGTPNLSIGINLPYYPDFEPVPGYPVYYAPRLDANYFFYDGLYWVFQDDSWFVSTWYNGPWQVVNPEYVPEYVLRVPVRYYRRPPSLFLGWQLNAPPLWGHYWGDDWSRRHSGWDQWNRRAVPKPAPLPLYQKKYSGDRYPGAEQRRSLQDKNYRYQARDPVVRQHVERPRSNAAPASAPVQGDRQERSKNNAGQRDNARPNPPAAAPQRAPASEQDKKRESDKAREQEEKREKGEGREQGGGREQERGRY